MHNTLVDCCHSVYLYIYQVNFLVYIIYVISESTANGCLSVDRHAVLLFLDSQLARCKMTEVQTEVQLEATYNIYNTNTEVVLLLVVLCVCVSQRIRLS